MAPSAVDDDTTAEQLRSAAQYLRDFYASTARQQSRLVKKAPLRDLHAAALGHPDPFVRRACLGFLDHKANEASTAVFAEALRDPVDFVRNTALHSIACESCRTEELGVGQVVPHVAAVLDGDPSPELRTKAIPTLLRLGGRDRRALEAIAHAGQADPDPIVRKAASDALAGRFVAPRKRYERHQRRHAHKSAGPTG